MRQLRILLFIALCTISSGMGAESLVTYTSYGKQPYIVENAGGVRCVYVFEHINDASFSTTNNELADWYEYPNLTTPVAANTNTYLDFKDGATYMVVCATKRDTFVVFDYSNHRIVGKNFNAALTCDNSVLSVDVPPMTYFSLVGQAYNIERDIVIRYNNLQRDSVSWVEKECEDTLYVTQPRNISLNKKLLIPTQIDLLGDRMAEHFYEKRDLVRINRDELNPIAIDFIPKSYTLLRGIERENEVERIVDETVLTGSAPMNVLFRSNATPLTTVFAWEVMRSEERLTSRTDTETRFQFEQTGKYTVKLHIANDDCECDTSFLIDAKESMLAVPNIFTPNGDGVNDEFRVAYRSIHSFSCLIFDRWQHQVYSSTDPARGWDGTINGRPAAESAYIYVIEAVGTDGVKYKKKGMVNLLRGKK